MRNGIRLLAIACLAACGGNEAKPVDAAVTPDAPPDAAVDAPIDAPSYNLSCAGMPYPTTAPAMITLGGVTATLAGMNPVPIADAQVEIYKRGIPAPVRTVTSAPTTGLWTSGPIGTGLVPYDGYLHASVGGATVYRSSYIFPPEPFRGDIATIPTPLVSMAQFQPFSGTQNDTDNGVLLVIVNDCATNLVGGATVTAKQGGNDVGQVVSLALVGINGVFFVLNVPDGETVVNATVNNTPFHANTVRAVKKSLAGADVNGTITATIVRPGPLP